jgi:hypothetical protein
MTAAAASVPVSAPGRSTRRAPWGGRAAATTVGTAAATAIPTGRLMKNTHRQLAYWTSRPLASTPTAAPAPAIAAQIPRARLRSGPWKVVVMIANAAGDSSAAPTPWPARPVTRTVPVWARPEASEAAVNTPSPARNIRRRPRVSASRPPSSSSPPKQSV